ncbi:hypothetical protein EVAR_66333_1 [Eumeta japonica]|uniref:Uncharacterized protein n=1 Tax=Eumeta variegata TaxID=151549 RepID=A0A4C1Z560_EUMVA|nr:hypothetical protein EVAR_66333_1 [Eumeta japonica]
MRSQPQDAPRGHVKSHRASTRFSSFNNQIEGSFLSPTSVTIPLAGNAISPGLMAGVVPPNASCAIFCQIWGGTGVDYFMLTKGYLGKMRHHRLWCHSTDSVMQPNNEPQQAVQNIVQVQSSDW